ncbi:MAG: glycosyltransferase [Alphaproteobacteria bacterium]|nr:glycosyltransferase [Alphaproteobacteria bacterium]
MPKVSIVIPCYNHGKFVDETVQSCLKQTYQDIEIIIVNDGSTDEYTNTLLKDYQRPKTKVITTQNQGLPAARNTGIREAVGEYILPLDADDKIAPTYIEKAVNVIEKNKKIGIVYADAEFFGAQSGRWKLPEYKLSKQLAGNCIFCSSLFRKSDWEKVGGYKKEMKYGLEDYEFWLSLIERGCEVYKIPEVLFYYRQHVEASMLKKLDSEKITYLYNVIFSFHKKLYRKNRKLLSANVRKMFDEFNHTFFYITKTESYKIYHLGKFQFKIKKG